MEVTGPGQPVTRKSELADKQSKGAKHHNTNPINFRKTMGLYITHALQKLIFIYFTFIYKQMS